MAIVKLNANQKKALEKLNDTPKTAAELGVAAATLTSLVNHGLAIKVGTRSPFKYSAAPKAQPGDSTLKTSDGKEFTVNMYLDKYMNKTVNWNDLNGNNHNGVCLKKTDDSFFVRNKDGVFEVKLQETVVVRFFAKGTPVKEFFRGTDY